jgi:uncharacterized protein DUF6766
METVALWTTSIILVGVSAFLIGLLVRSIVHERRASGVRRLWRNFGLSLTFVILFLISWAGQGVAEWVSFAHEQAAHGQVTHFSDFWVEFGQSTLENWQSEFLQLFSFVVVAAVLIHRGSGESKDGTDRIEKAVNEIRDMLREAGLPEKTSSGRR